VKGTWKEGSLVGDPEGLLEEALKTGICFIRGPVGESGRRLIYRGF